MYICLPRSLLTSEIYRDPDLARLFVYLLSKIDAKGVAEISIRGAVIATGLSQRKVITNLNRLKATHKTTQQTTHKTTQVTLCDTTATPRRATHKTTQQTTHKTTQQKFTPPTHDEAQQYINDMGFHWGNADLFIDFYQQKGWRLTDGKPMTDWKAAMRNWENRWNFKYGKNNETKYDPRRPTDVADHTASDYGGPF